MFISMPIKNFNLSDNKLRVNDTIIEFESISEDNREILESLISKGAYGSALLTLNTLYNVKTINESECTQDEYSKYLRECNNLMKECVSETKAHNFRPLINLKGLEIMESSNQIARGKGDKLLVEDFRNNKVLKEDNYDDPFFSSIEEALYNAGFDVTRFSDAGVLTKNLGWYVSNSEGEVQLQCNGAYLSESTDIQAGNTNADNIVLEFSKSDRDIDTFTKALTEISKLEYDGIINTDKYDECIKKLQDLYVNKDMMIEECGGTQCSDIAEKKDQEVGSLQRPKKSKKHFNEMFMVPKNHGFKGFRLDEQGHYTRGNYILINEKGTIKAINKTRLNETTNKEINTKRDTIFTKIRQALKDAGDKEWENIIGYKKRLPQDIADELDREENELSCIEMIHSILTYSNNRNADEVINDKYLEKYIDELGRDKVMELLKNEIEEFNNATINRDVYTDSEGVTYNSVTFKDDIE